MGRFINADSYTSTGQGILGHNMFAYCGNNPIVRIDPSGLFWWDDFWYNVKEWLEEEKEKASTNEDGTTTIGATGSAAFGVGGSVSLGLTTDKKGNIGFALSVNGGGGFPSVGVGAYKTTTNAPNIYKQAGIGGVVGASGGPFVVGVGVEYNILIDTDESSAYHGVTTSATYGFYPTVVEVHGEIGYTWVWGVNIYDAALGIVDFISGN